MTANVRRGWMYDSDWDYFVTESSAHQTLALLEAVEREPQWAATVGLDHETVMWLVANPTPGAYISGTDGEPYRRATERITREREHNQPQGHSA